MERSSLSRIAEVLLGLRLADGVDGLWVTARGAKILASCVTGKGGNPL